jgi:hypothetical protein
MTTYPWKPALPRPPEERSIVGLLTYALGFGAILTFIAIVHFGNVWRMYRFPHAVSVVTSLREGISYGRHGEQDPYTIGELTFVREHDGKSYSCDEEVNLGDYPSIYKIGQELDVVPRTGTCWHPLVVDMVNRWKR